MIISILIILFVSLAGYIVYRIKDLERRYDIGKNQVYYKGWSGYFNRVLEGADPNSFEVLKNKFYGKDKNLVFFRGDKIPGADASSFISVDDLYAKDKSRGYYNGSPIESSHGASFTVIDNDYSTDGIDIFYGSIPLRVCSKKNFKFIYPTPDDGDYHYRLYPWATDGCYYYFKNYKIPSDDYQNVQVFKGTNGVAKDKLWIYYQDHRINYNQKGEKLFDVDVASFTYHDPFVDGGQDKYGCIDGKEGRVKCE